MLLDQTDIEELFEKKCCCFGAFAATGFTAAAVAANVSVVGTAISLMSVDEHKFLRGIEALLKSKIDQKIEEGFKPSDKPSSAPKSRNFRGRSNFSKGKPGKPGFSKGKPGGGGKPSFAKGKSGSSGKPVNKKSGSKAKTRWKKTKKT